jgi:hypothetical protein
MVSLFSLTSCEKFLDVKPNDQIDESEALTSKSRIQRALTGVYSRLQVTEYYGAEWPNAIWLSGDNVVPFSGGTTDLQFAGHAVLSSSNTMEITWNAMYKAINMANNVIDGATKVEDPNMTQAERNDILGQAQFLRALVYFDMVRTWGGVPLVTTPTRGLGESSFPAKATVDQVYTQIIQDLTDAEANLPESGARTIATKKAAQALRAKVALYRGDWPNAISYATTVINSNNYSLVTPFEKLITDKQNTESIFELDYSNVDPNELSAYFYPTTMGGYYRVGPTAAITSLLEDENVGGDRSVMIAYHNGAVYGNRYRKATGNVKDDNYAIIRLAEMYLIRAEARANQDQLNEALEDLNTIRERANVAPLAIANKQDLLLAIENERRVEFAFEPHRWFDLIRTGRAGAVLGVTDARKYVFPIPGAEILANPNLAQNEGY